MLPILQISILLAIYLNIGSAMGQQHPSNKQISVYWNVPTVCCKNYKENFEKILEKNNIKHNEGDKFKGETISILYNPGLFPIVKKSKQATYVRINEGIPQLGNIKMHLEALEKTLRKELPVGFRGIGVIDFEDWRPIFRQNWNEQVIYKNLSIEWAQEIYFNQMKDFKQIFNAAKENFEKAAIDFMVKTLEKAKEVFPEAAWGFYGFPYCYNHYNKVTTECAKGVTDENNRIQRIFDKSDVLFPSIYVNSTMSREKKQDLIIGRIKEAKRVYEKRGANHKAFVLPYMWVRFIDSKSHLSITDVEDALNIVKKYNTGGVIIWGGSEDVASEEKCQSLLKFVKNVLGPAMKKVGIK